MTHRSGALVAILTLLLVASPLAGVATPDTEETLDCDAKGLIPLTGCHAWASSYDGQSHQLITESWQDHSSGLAVAPGGDTAFISGAEPAGDWFQGFVQANDGTTGEVLWSATEAGEPQAFLTGVASSPDGSTVFIAGKGNETEGQDVAKLYARDARTGDIQWMNEFRGDRLESPDISFTWNYLHRILVSPSGETVYGVGVVENAQDSGGKLDFLVVAVDASTGDVLWERHWDSPGAHPDWGAYVALDADRGRVFAVGSGLGNDDIGVIALALDADTGDTLWSQTFPALSADEPTGVGVSPKTGHLYITSTLIVMQPGIFTRALDGATGEVVWDANAKGWDLTVDPTGERVFVTRGLSADLMKPSRPSRTVTVAFDAETGERLWRDVYEPLPGRSNGGKALATSPDGKCLYVTGYTWGYNRDDVLTRAIDPATGETLWEARYGGLHHLDDEGRLIEVDPVTGDVFVAGITEHADSAQDALLLKYENPCDRVYS